MKAFAFLVVMVALVSTGCDSERDASSCTLQEGVFGEKFAESKKAIGQSLRGYGRWVEIVESDRHPHGDTCYLNVGDELSGVSLDRYAVVSHKGWDGYGTSCDDGDIVTCEPSY